MKKRTTKTEISIIGLELANNVLQLPGIDEPGEVVLTKQPRHAGLVKYFAQLKSCLIDPNIVRIRYPANGR